MPRSVHSPPRLSYRLTPWPPPETVCRALPHTEQPHLCVRMTAQQRRSRYNHRGRGDTLPSEFDRHELAFVPRPKVRTDITRIDGLSPLVKLRCAVAWSNMAMVFPESRAKLPEFKIGKALCGRTGASFVVAITTKKGYGRSCLGEADASCPVDGACGSTWCARAAGGPWSLYNGRRGPQAAAGVPRASCGLRFGSRFSIRVALLCAFSATQIHRIYNIHTIR